MAKRSTAPGVSKKKIFSRIMKELARLRAPLILSILFSALSVALSLYVPVLIGRTIDGMIDGVAKGDVVKNIFVIAGFALTSAIFKWISETSSAVISADAVASLRKKAFYKLSRLPVSFYDKNPKGDVISRIMTDTDAVGAGLLLGMSQFFSGIVTVAATLVLMLTISAKITALVVFLTPLSLVVAAAIAKSTYKLFLDRSKKNANETSFLSEVLKNIKLVKSFVGEDRFAEKYDSVTEELAASSKRAIFASSLTNPATRFVGSVIYAAVGLAGALTVIGGALTVGGLTCFLSYAGQYSKPFNEISAVIAEIQGSIASASRVFEIIDSEEEEDGGEPVDGCDGRVRFSDVTFSYDGKSNQLKDVSFEVSPGERVAIVGPTGCGKTTLINLLMRFYDPVSGSIEVDGKNTLNIPRKNLRDRFGMVLQDTFLFDATVGENLTIGASGVSDDEMIAAAKLSNAHSFIKKLPDGYDTRLSGGGEALSEGERQLISITRVILSKPSILILDEATSSIDTRTEEKINDALEKLMEGKTSFIVAHRITTVKNADLILVMRDGEIVERGRHTELMERGGFYKELYESQFES